MLLTIGFIIARWYIVLPICILYWIFISVKVQRDTTGFYTEGERRRYINGEE